MHSLLAKYPDLARKTPGRNAYHFTQHRYTTSWADRTEKARHIAAYLGLATCLDKRNLLLGLSHRQTADDNIKADKRLNDSVSYLAELNRLHNYTSLGVVNHRLFTN